MPYHNYRMGTNIYNLIGNLAKAVGILSKEKYHQNPGSKFAEAGPLGPQAAKGRLGKLKANVATLFLWLVTLTDPPIFSARGSNC